MREVIKQWEKTLGRNINYEEFPDSSHIEISNERLIGINDMPADIKNVTFNRCNLTGTKFNASRFTSVEFKYCNLTDCDFSSAVFGDYNSFNWSYGNNISFIKTVIRNQLFMEHAQFDSCHFNELKCDDGWIEASYSSITNSKFIGSVNLNGTFQYTNFEGSDFSYMDLGEFLRGAYRIDMSRTQLVKSCLSNVNAKSIRTLNMALMDGCCLQYVNMESVNLSYTNMSNAIMLGCLFENCIFDHSLMSNSSIENVRFQYGCVACSDITHAKLVDVKFNNVNMTLTDMCETQVNAVDIANCNMELAMMNEATFRALTLKNSDTNRISIVNIDTNEVAKLSREVGNTMQTIPIHKDPEAWEIVHYIKGVTNADTERK